MLISNLQRELVILGQFLQERFQEGEKVCLGLEYHLIEIAELEKQRSELVTQCLHRFEEMIQILVTIKEHLFMGDDLRDFRAEQETGRGPGIPMITGVVYGVAPSHLVATRLLGAFVLLLMLVLEFVLNFLAARVETRQITARL